MNWRHLRAFVWLRWRLFVNQARRGGAVNAVLMMILAGCALLVAAPLFIACFALALHAFPEAAPVHLLYAWDGVIVGFVFFWGIGLVTELQRTGVGAIALVLFGMLQLMANQFGFDRDGFRVFVLCAAPRRDILLGKNLAFAPLALGMAVVLLTVSQVVCPMRLDHFLAMLPRFVSMFLLFCILTNLLSIYAPMPIAAGSLKPANTKLIPALLQVAMFTFLFPLTQAPTLLPLGIEAGLEWLGWTAGAPICLVLSLAQCAAVVLIYRFSLNWQGGLFEARERRILESVTNRAA